MPSIKTKYLSYLLQSFMALISNKCQRGFSLVELSVVMTIIGVTLGSALTLATNITEEDRITTTNRQYSQFQN